ncbi:MAG: sigma 54-interacting transcriptional regulator [Pyrinomonadaceae bacterium]
MDPHLIAISGSLKGTTFALSNHEISIGREASNGICLNDASVSRRHCVLTRDANPAPADSPQFKIVDLESFNGTFVNGTPVKEHTLAHGDQIALGDVQFLFLLHEVEAGTAPVQFDEGDLITRSTVRLQREDAFYLRPERVLAELPQTARVARELNALLKISTTINSIRNLRELQHRLLELILEVIPAEREAILLVDGSPAAFSSVSGWNRKTGPDDSLKVSRTITNQVLDEEVALLSNDILENERADGTPSLIAARVCSVLCVPLVSFNKSLGVIYLDTSNPTGRFDEGHLQLLTAIAGIAAIAIENVQHLEWLEVETHRLQEQFHLEHKMIGESAPMREVYNLLAKAAPTESTVLLRGESGTGKELAAHAIHLNSSRAAKSFVAINCATLSETLLESELFGHEKGAFTGAIAQRRGKLEVADGGTVFLDEVGELTPMIQAKLLRVLQEREFERVGSTRNIKVNVRIIAATNKNLEDAIRSGSFRQDLYYRLNVISITIPPLRERREDISLLASYFVAKYSKLCKRRVSGISLEARNILRSYDWPGNVRELENAIERAVVLGSSEALQCEDLPETLLEAESGTSPEDVGYYEALREMKKQLLNKTLEQTGGSYTEAAKLLGIHPNNLHRLMRSLDLKKK